MGQSDSHYGSYIIALNMIVIVEGLHDPAVLPLSSWDDYDKTVTSSTIQHEFVHAVDYFGNKTRDCEGIFHDMTKEQKEKFIKIRNEFINKKYPEGTWAREKMPNYALGKSKDGKYVDFPTVTCMLFIHRPNDLQKLSPELYKLYVEYFGLDPIVMKYPNRG